MFYQSYDKSIYSLEKVEGVSLRDGVLMIFDEYGNYEFPESANRITKDFGCIPTFLEVFFNFLKSEKSFSYKEMIYEVKRLGD